MDEYSFTVHSSRTVIKSRKVKAPPRMKEIIQATRASFHRSSPADHFSGSGKCVSVGLSSSLIGIYLSIECEAVHNEAPEGSIPSPPACAGPYNSWGFGMTKALRGFPLSSTVEKA